MKMKTLNTYTDAYDYAKRIGFTNPDNSVASRMDDLVTIRRLIERMSGGKYPCQVRTALYVDGGFRYPWLSTIYVAGGLDHTQCDLTSWHGKVEDAPICYYTVKITVDGEPDPDIAAFPRRFWLHEAKQEMKKYILGAPRKFPNHRSNLDPSGMSGTIITPDNILIEADIQWHDLEGAVR
jgi:hypothetical protein